MKVVSAYLAFLFVLLIFIPYLATSCWSMNEVRKNDIVSVYNHKSKETKNINLEEYVVSVVCAEMPASFEAEALKAQAVAARTYALRKINSQSPEHNGAQLCTDYAHCQAYETDESLAEKWGKDYKDNYKKIKDAVESTAGEYVVYNGEIATTVFHSCSNGVTEKSSDVWGGEIPYLINVSSPGDFEKNEYEKAYRFSYNEFVNKLNIENKTAIDETKPAIGNVTLSSGGNVLKMELFDCVYEGTDLRRIFNLNSTAFNLEYTDGIFIFTVCGSGHGVGMSQYGANDMAKNGSNYNDIIAHYYPGTKLEKLSS